MTGNELVLTFGEIMMRLSPKDHLRIEQAADMARLISRLQPKCSCIAQSRRTYSLATNCMNAVL